MAKKQELPENVPTAAEFAAGGHHQSPPGKRDDWEHDFYDQRHGFVRFRHKTTGQTVVCPNMWYNGTPQSAIDRRRHWIAEGEERRKYWESKPPGWEPEYHLKQIEAQRGIHLEAIALIEATGKVM